MKEIVLFEHNEKAYNKLIENLKETNITTINHATGTGKSFILLKYLYENKNKKILYLAPSSPIIDQLLFEHMKTLNISVSEFEQFDTLTYMGLVRRDPEKIVNDYDIIILDEYHRCGAPLTYKSASKIVNLIKEKYPNKVVIGTTATEIRYLDHEKDMKEILFDGNCASELSLADAIIEGILPAPKYVFVPHLLLEGLKKLRKMIEYNFMWDVDYQKYMKMCDDFENKVHYLIEKYKPVNNEINLDGNQCKKFLVFSSTVDNMKNTDKKIMHRLLENHELNENIVYHGNTKKKNRKAIDNFKNACEGINLLYSVNLLSEGFHVKDVDAIFMLRKTSSPIIYFQHLGRLLSYSAKDKDVYVFDVVNNMSNHKEIVKLYDDLFSRLKKLIEENKDNKKYVEKLTEIKNKLGVIDYSDSLYTEYYKIKSLVSNTNAIRNRLVSAVKVLSGEVKSCSIVEKESAYMFVQKHFEHVDLELFKIIKNLNIYESGIYTRSIEDFKNMLHGFETIYDYKTLNSVEINNQISNYILNSCKIPSLLSSNIEECKIANFIASNFKYLSADLKNEIKDLVKRDESLTEFDKITYISNYEILDKENFKKDFEYALNNNIYISDRLFNYYYGMDDASRLNKKTEFEFTKYFEDLRMKCIKEISIKGEFETCKTFVDEYINFINKKLYMPTYNVKNKEELELYSKYIIFKSTIIYYKLDEKINKFLEENKLRLNLHIVYMNKITDFYKFNCRLPLNNSKDPEEYNLANYLSDYSASLSNDEKKILLSKISFDCYNVTINDLISFVKNNEGILPSPYKESEAPFYKFFKKISKEDREKLYLVLEEYEDSYIEMAQEYINFIKENRRYPLLISDNKEEAELAHNYSVMKGFIPKEYKVLINQTIIKYNKHDIEINTYNKTQEINRDFVREKI